MPVMPLVSHRSHRRHPSPLDIFNLFTWTPPLHTDRTSPSLLHNKKKCIPTGCVPSSGVAVSPTTHAPRHPCPWPHTPPGQRYPGHAHLTCHVRLPGMHAPLVVHTSRFACSPSHTSLPPPQVRTPHPPLNRMTDRQNDDFKEQFKETLCFCQGTMACTSFVFLW